MCLYPRLIENRRYVANKSNGGNVPIPKDERMRIVPIGCGNCMVCRKKRANEWKIRLYEEIKYRKGQFVTFTFNDESLVKLEEDLRKKGCTLEDENLDDEIVKLAVMRFSDNFKTKHKRRPRRWFVTEIGGTRTQRIHVHGIYFEDCSKEEIENYWKFGNVWIGDYCTRSSITYIVKYMTKVDEKHPYYKGLVLCSNGIGKGYKETGNFQRSKYKGKDTQDYYRSENGFKLSNPIYYRNLLYSEEERELLWIHKLDEQRRWIHDIEIDLRMRGVEEYIERVLREKRELNRVCKFGSNVVDWDKRRYQRMQRRLAKMQRFAKVRKTVTA